MAKEVGDVAAGAPASSSRVAAVLRNACEVTHAQGAGSSLSGSRPSVLKISPKSAVVFEDILQVKCVGSTFTLYRNGAQVGEVTDSTNPTGDPGIQVGAGGSKWDDMSVASA